MTSRAPGRLPIWFSMQPTANPQWTSHWRRSNTGPKVVDHGGDRRYIARMRKATAAESKAATAAVTALGSAPTLPAPDPANPLAAISATASGLGYWVASPQGAVFAYGDAPYLGGLAARPASPIVELVPTHT